MDRRTLIGVAGIAALSAKTGTPKNTKPISTAFKNPAMLTFGTKTYIRKDGTTVIIPPNIDYKPSADEKMVYGVRDIDIHMHLNDVISADIQVFPGMESSYQVVGHYMTICPQTGKFKEVEKIIFKDGSEWKP